jgi:putative transposase
MEYVRGELVLLHDDPEETYRYVGYEPAVDKHNIESKEGEAKSVAYEQILRPSPSALRELIARSLKEQNLQIHEAMSERNVSAELYTPKQLEVGLARLEIIQKLERGEIDGLDNAKSAMGLKQTAFDDVMKRYAADPGLHAVVPGIPGRKAGQSDQDTELIAVYMKCFDRTYVNNATAKAVYSDFTDHCKKNNLKPFSRSTAGRIFRGIDPRIRESKTIGPDHAQKKFGAYPGTLEFDRPLRRVQIDSSPADIMVVDKNTGKCLGRPYLTIVWDDYSGAILAALITFIPPCRATIAGAMMQAFTPKNKLLADLGLSGQRWTAYGRPSEILVDKGSEHDNHDLKITCDKFGIKYGFRMRPETGGAVESGIKLFNTFFMQRLAGSTGSAPKKIKDFNPEKKARYDVLALQQLVILEAIRLNDEVREGDRLSPNMRMDNYYSDPDTPFNMPPLMKNATAFMLNMLPGGRVYVRREGIKYGGYTYDHGPVRNLVERKIKVSVKRSPLDYHTLWVLHDGTWTKCPVLKPSKVPRTLIDAQILKRSRGKAGDMTEVGHDAVTAIQDIIAKNSPEGRRAARAGASLAIAVAQHLLPEDDQVHTNHAASVAASAKASANASAKTQSAAIAVPEVDRFASVRPYKGEDD